MEAEKVVEVGKYRNSQAVGRTAAQDRGIATAAAAVLVEEEVGKSNWRKTFLKELHLQISW